MSYTNELNKSIFPEKCSILLGRTLYVYTRWSDSLAAPENHGSGWGPGVI